MVSLFIDGKKVESEPSQTILQAAQKAGIHIPTLCHDSRLAPTGACRMCVVEIEGVRSLVASSATPVSKDIKVSTRSESVMRARKLNLELIWSVCPVGALMDKPAIKKGRPWETRKVHIVCCYCGVGCSLVLHIKQNEILKVTADTHSPPNYGSLCVKGRYGFEFHKSDDRLKSPLIRDHIDQPFREASWEEVISLVARRFMEIRLKYGPDAFGCLSSSRGTNEENYLAQKFTRAVMDTNNVDNCARVCHAPSVTGLRASLGSGAATNSLADIEGAEVLIVSGSNTTEAHPVAALKIKKAVRHNGAKLIVMERIYWHLPLNIRYVL